MAGIAFDDLDIIGLVTDCPWGSWDNPHQVNSAFGVSGVSVINGGLRMREFAVKIMVWGWTSQAARDAAIFGFEEYIGTVAGITVTIPAATLINMGSNVRMANLQWGRPGYDATHLFWRELIFNFEQLAPPEPPVDDVSSSSSSSS